MMGRFQHFYTENKGHKEKARMDPQKMVQAVIPVDLWSIRFLEKCLKVPDINNSSIEITYSV